MKLKSYAKASAIMPFLIIGIPIILIVIAFTSKTDEGRKIVEKIKEFLPADIVPPAK